MYINILTLLLTLLTLFSEIAFNILTLGDTNFRYYLLIIPTTCANHLDTLSRRDQGIKGNHFVVRIDPQVRGSPVSHGGDIFSCETAADATSLPHVGRCTSILHRPPILSSSPPVRLACRSVKLPGFLPMEGAYAILPYTAR